jgi:hypothetical protein
VFVRAVLVGAVLVGAVFVGAVFVGLVGAVFVGLVGAVFVGAVFVGAVIRTAGSVARAFRTGVSHGRFDRQMDRTQRHKDTEAGESEEKRIRAHPLRSSVENTRLRAQFRGRPRVR